MNHVEDSEYLGSRETWCLVALPVGVHGGRSGTQLYYYCSLPHWVNGYNL